jgi:hypothetical protein
MSIVLVGSSSGSITLQEPAVAGTTTLNLPATSGTVVVTGTTPTLNGITFPATQVPSADANTLDDYEEGTWTPSITFAGSSTGITYVAQVGKYTKIGNIVFAGFHFELSSKGSATGQARINGLPFTSSSSEASRMGSSAGYYGNFSSTVTTVLLMAETNQTFATLRYAGAGAALDMTSTLFNNNSGLYGVFIYQV